MEVCYYFIIMSNFVFHCATPSYSDVPWICPNITNRQQWEAKMSHAIDYLIIPVKNVIIHHTVTPECKTVKECKELIKAIQAFHMDMMEFHDIGYNFLVGGDGNIYEGVGWHKVGAHTRGYNSRSIGIAFIGDYSENLPNKSMLRAFQRLLGCGLELGELQIDYKLFGARQVSATTSPGNKLYQHLRKWPHFSNNP